MLDDVSAATIEPQSLSTRLRSGVGAMAGLRAHLVIAFTLLCLVAVPAAADPILPLSEVQPGMVGEARTVIRGTEIVRFPVTVLDVLRAADAPGGIQILVRAEGPVMEETGGLASGMSGSPVYVTGTDGVPRVMGALAFASGDQANVVGGVTPIEQMIASNSGMRAMALARTATDAARRTVIVPNRAAAMALQASQPGLIALHPLTRWTMAGVSRPVRGRLAARLARLGIGLTSIGPRAPRPPVPLVPGASMTALLAGGDVSVGAAGTVTYVDGATVLGFGHSLLSAGRSRFLLGDAYVNASIAAPINGWSYKIVEPGGLQGMVVGDRADAVTGQVGPVEAISVVSTATDLSRGTTSTVRGSIAPDVRTAPDISGTYQDEPAARVTDGDTGGTLTVRFSISSPDLPRPFVYRNVYAATESVIWVAGGTLPYPMDILMRNGLRPVPISAIQASETVESRVRAARIVSAGVRNVKRSSRRATLILRVRPWQESSHLIRVPVTLPIGVNPSSPVMQVVPNAPDGGFYGPEFFDGSDLPTNGEASSVAPAGSLRNAFVRAQRSALKAKGTRLERVMAGLSAAFNDRHDAVRLLAEGDNPKDPTAGVVVPVPYVVYGDGVTIGVRFPPRPRPRPPAKPVAVLG